MRAWNELSAFLDLFVMRREIAFGESVGHIVGLAVGFVLEGGTC